MRKVNGLVQGGVAIGLALWAAGVAAQAQSPIIPGVYTCTDAKGCPLAYKVFYDLNREIENTPSMHDKVRFVSLSFDPQHDTPDIMRLYGGSYLKSSKGLPWYFLTTPSFKELRPLLDGFGQDVSVEVNPKDKAIRAFSHVLKIFLIDENGSVREIYTTSYLVPEVVLNDMKTLLMEKGK